MEFKEFMRWNPDDMPLSTDAVIVVSKCGTVIKRLPYKKWNHKNNGYSNMKEHIYPYSSNRGKQRFESQEKIEKYGLYMHVTIKDCVHPVHRVVASAWIDNNDNLPCVNHINGIRDDNRVENLEWVTNQENVNHAWETGMRDVARMMKIHESQMPKIMQMKADGLSNPAIGRHFGVTGETIRVRIMKYENSLRSKR